MQTSAAGVMLWYVDFQLQDLDKHSLSRVQDMDIVQVVETVQAPEVDECSLTKCMEDRHYRQVEVVQ